MDKEREIQEVRMGKEGMVARPGYTIALDVVNMVAMECNIETKTISREIWLGPGAFISWKEQ